MGRPPAGGIRPATLIYGVALVAGIFVFYFLPYAIRHLRVPIGFDTPWYLVHARDIAANGIGRGTSAFKLGYPLLSVTLGRVMGRSQLEMITILPSLLVAVWALTVGAFVRIGLGMSRSRTAIVVLVAAAVLGATDLMGENLGALLLATFSVAALLLLIGDRSRWTLCGAAVVLTAAGLSHWDFLAVTDCVLVVAVLLSLRSSREEFRRGTSLLRTDSARFAVAALVASALTFGLVFWVLHASLVTVELAQFPGAWLHKFLTRFTLLAPAVAGLFAVGIVDACFPELRADRAFDPSTSRRVIKAWGYTMAAGILFGLLTLKVPPSRFLDLLLAFPASVAVGAAVALLGEGVAGRVGSRERPVAGRRAAIAAVGAGILLLAVPGMIRWYPYATWLDADAVSQAGAADGYLDTLGPRSPIVFVLEYTPEFAQGVAAEERNVLFGLSPQNEDRARFFVGDPADALAGRRTAPPDKNSGEMTQPYWEAVRSILPSKPPVVVLRSLAPRQFRDARPLGGKEIAPGVMLLRGPAPPSPVALGPVPDAAPWLPVALGWALLTFALLAVAGIGWSYSFLGGRRPFEEMLGLAPALGAAAIVLGAFLVDEVGIRPGRLGGVVGFVLAAASGIGAAWSRMRRTASGPDLPVRGRRYRRVKITPSSSV